MKTSPLPTTKLAELAFTPWMRWADRHQVDGIERAGVYLLARFGNKPRKRVDPLDPRIVYVGETTRKTLGYRWNQFNRSAFEKKGGHSGGWTYAAQCEADHDGLYVAALPCDLEEPHLSAYVRLVERVVLWEFVARNQRPPVCNRK